ncbi:type III toxin-antitoxin system ToxN/AbiQ family toxin [Lactobacillus helveticus]|nr:type III toxin-antitoxin system ToxN/AbiQ family toxin [Lactobacillus helveticus]
MNEEHKSGCSQKNSKQRDHPSICWVVGHGEYMNWCSIDETYVNYLKSYESRIPYSDYGVNHFKPFFRPLFEIEPGIIFVGAISHPQDRHRKMKNKPDFRKIFID